jgi:hypothetical protein
MLDTKLILIEGFPGAGKSTTTGYLQSIFQQHGLPCRQYLEDDASHPIACLDFEIKGLTEKIIPLWKNFVEQAALEPIITIMESRLWQNTALFMYMSEVDFGDIAEYNRQVWQAFLPLTPVLIYLDQDDTESALRRLYASRGKEWMDWALNMTAQYPWFQSRGLHDFAGWVRFFDEWRQVANGLYDDWPGQKVKILNPHEDWGRSYRELCTFLQVDENR